MRTLGEFLLRHSTDRLASLTRSHTFTRPVGILDAIYGTSKNFQRIMREALDRNEGSYEKASRELTTDVARWEADREARESAAGMTLAGTAGGQALGGKAVDGTH